MASSITINGLSEMESRLSSHSMDDEESFVVLNNCVDEVTGQLISLQCTEATESLLTTMQPIEKIETTTTTTDGVGNVSSTTMVTSQESNVSGTSELSAEEIQQKMGSLLRENSELKESLKQNNLAIKQQYDALAKWQEDVVKVQESHKIKFEETKKLVLNLKTENAELRKLVNSPNESSKEEVNLKSKISALEFELDTLRAANAKFNNDQAKIIQELELKLSESEKLRFEESTKQKSQIESLMSQLRHVEAEYEKIKEELVEVKKKVPNEMELANAENLKEQLKELAQEVVLKNTMLKEKTDLIDNIHETISKLKIENECIPILKTQVEVYQTDFNQERQEREKLKAEKDKIAEDLKHLHRRNQKLLEQIELLQRDSYVHVTESASSASSQPSTTNRNTPTREQSPPLTAFTCPICANNYRNLVSLQEHVELCLQQNSSN